MRGSRNRRRARADRGGGRMSRWKNRRRRTDYGTIVLHWTLVSLLVISLVTGLRIASETPDHTWVNVLDDMLPRATVWTAHMPAALGLITVAIAYAVYMSASGLARRIRPDRARMLGLFGNRQARWSAVNVILYWGFFAILLLQLATGGLLYFGYTSDTLITLHWLGTWAILGYAAAHVLAHWRLGGTLQLLRIFRPAPLAPPPPPLDPVQLLVLLAERMEAQTHLAQTSRVPPAQASSAQAFPAQASPAMRAERTPDTPRNPNPVDRPQQPRRPAPPRPDGPPSVRAPYPHRPLPDQAKNQTKNHGRAQRPGPVLQANPFIVAISVAIAGAFFVVAIDRETVDTLHVRRIAASEVPVLDGDTSDPVWRTAQPIYVTTGQGGNFDGAGDTTIEVRAVHDGVQAYFLFAWDDPTRSLKQLPLIKKADGWHLLHDGYEIGDEHAYNEDKFSVLLTTMDVVLAGDRTFHAGPAPIAGRPRTLSGRGLHYTMDEGTYADVWEWKATDTAPSGHMDDDHFGPPAAPTQAQMSGMMPYHGGFAPDPGTASYADNFDPRPPESYGQPLKPRRLPKDLRATLAAMGPVDLDPNHGESEGARWFMTEAESASYSAALDARIPLDTVIPGVIISGAFSGDRADIRCAARWAAGRWALEASRRLDTHSKYDVPITTGTFMRVAAFDHNQIRHTRHVRPIRLEVE